MNFIAKACIAFLGVYFIGQFLAQNGSVVSPIKPVSSGCSIPFAKYEQLASGMSYASAVRVLGCPGREMSRSDMAGYTTVMLGWDGEGMIGANMSAMFQNDRLVNKAQFGMR